MTIIPILLLNVELLLAMTLFLVTQDLYTVIYVSIIINVKPYVKPILDD